MSILKHIINFNNYKQENNMPTYREEYEQAQYKIKAIKEQYIIKLADTILECPFSNMKHDRDRLIKYLTELSDKEDLVLGLISGLEWRLDK